MPRTKVGANGKMKTVGSLDDRGRHEEGSESVTSCRSMAGCAYRWTEDGNTGQQQHT
ncbi:hypothetical protein ACLOJK_034603, partial [Asimina triloba]